MVNPGAIALAALALLAGTLLPAQRARACTQIAPELADPRFAIDPALRATDHDPPVPIAEAGAVVTRRTDSVCSGGSCTVTDCGRYGQLTLDYLRAQPADEAEEVGYRVELLSGELPPSMRTLVGPVRPLSPRIVFDMAFDDAPVLDAEIAVVVIDRAGNESAPSDPIHLLWSGCTLPPAGEQCLDAGEGGCAIAGTRSARGAPVALLLLGLVALAVRRAP